MSANAGDIVKVYCEECKLNSDASVLAVVGDEIVSVECRTCSSNQRFVPAEDAKATAARRAAGRRVVDVSPRRKGGGRSRGRRPTPASTDLPPPRPRPRPEAAPRVAAYTPPPPAPDDPLRIRWEAATAEVESRYARPHRATERYDVGEMILDHVYGMGIVEERSEDGTLKVLFRGGYQSFPSRAGDAPPPNPEADTG